jgi:hypothetical protein
MRLSCHLISGGKFYHAGVEIPEGVAVPGGAMKYVVSDGPKNVVLNENNDLTAIPPEDTSHPGLFAL